MEMFTRLFLIVMVTGIVLGSGKDLPNSFMKCKRSDPDFTKCLMTAGTGAIHAMKSGLPEFGILPLEPFAVDSLTISQGSANRPINIRQKFKNIKIYYFTDFTIKKFNGGLDNYRLNVVTLAPRIEMIGDYEMDGQALVLPITGKGKANITLIESTVVNDLIFEPFKKDDEEYWRLKQYKVKLEPKRMYTHFENLFNGDKLLGDTMNNFMNENWQVVFNEVKGGYEETFGLMFKDICNKIFLNVPINKIFLD